MKDPVVLITGALTGIGRATALAFVNEGGRIVASGRRDAEGHELVAELRKLGAEPSFCAPMCATRTTCAAWLTRRSPGLVAWMWPS
jgi:NAD(P)-dependent dehydrogenase (short-subunit alcohol dehydrogenase family)